MNALTTPTLPGTDRAKRIVTLGFMAWANPSAVDERMRMHAGWALDAVVAYAQNQGFREKTKFVSSLRRGRPTPKVMERAEKIAALVTDAQIEHEIQRIEWWRANTQPHLKR